MKKVLFLASAAWGSVHLPYSAGLIGPWKRHTQKWSDFQGRRMHDDVERYAVAKTDGGLET
jgi:hypothetical protein